MLNLPWFILNNAHCKSLLEIFTYRNLSIFHCFFGSKQLFIYFKFTKIENNLYHIVFFGFHPCCLTSSRWEHIPLIHVESFIHINFIQFVISIQVSHLVCVKQNSILVFISVDKTWFSFINNGSISPTFSYFIHIVKFVK